MAPLWIGDSGFDLGFFLFGLGFVFVSASEFEEGKSLSAHDTAKQSATRAAANMTRSRSPRVLSASCSALIFSSRVIAACAPEAEGVKLLLICNQLSAPPAASVFVLMYQ